ncbi:MAG: hypothetical protein QGH24_01795 [Candidatus Marinimicrobia bacterium]|nr:hypothetical protein [Candidatus Neomarinimicrobiota bacterium]
MNFNYGLAEDWNLETNLSFGIRKMDFLGRENDHHRDESRSGIGDLRLTLRYLSSNVTFGPGTRLFLGGGIILPSNNTVKKNPFAENVGPHTHFDMSEGAIKYVGEIQYFKRDNSPIVKGGILKFTSATKENKYSYKPGYQLDGIAMFYWQTKEILKGIPQFSFVAQNRGVDHWEGIETPNSGGSIIQGSVGLMWNLDPHHITVSLRMPLYQNLNMVKEGSSVDNHAKMWGFSLSYRTIISLGEE